MRELLYTEIDAIRGMLWGAAYGLALWFLLVTLALAQTTDTGEGFPIVVNSTTPQTVNLPLTDTPAGDVLVAITASDPDHASEGEMRVNGYGPVTLFGAERAQWTIPAGEPATPGVTYYPSLNNATVTTHYLTPGAWWQRGPNVVEFRLIATLGYTVTALSATYSVDTVPQVSGIVAQVQDSEWALPAWWLSAIMRGDWGVKVRTSTTPDYVYVWLTNRETLARYIVKANRDKYTKVVLGQAQIDPATPRTDLDLCDHAIVGGGDALKACAIVYASSTATSAYFYAEPITSSARVGKVAKGATCRDWLVHAPTQTANLHWFMGAAPDTGRVGFVRCKDLSN